MNLFGRTSTVELGRAPFAMDGWHTLTVHYHNFEGLSTKKDKAVEFRYDLFGRTWLIELFPGGTTDAREGMVSLNVTLEDEEQYENVRPIDIKCEASVLNWDGDAMGNVFHPGTLRFDGYDRVHGNDNFFLSELVRCPSFNILVNGALVVEIKMKKRVRMNQPFEPFVPKIDCRKKMEDLRYQDAEYKDVAFRVEECDSADHESIFYAHRSVLQVCAPGLFDLCEPFGRDTEVPLTNVSCNVFNILLDYVYGLGIGVADWKLSARDLLEAADRYDISDLKLEAEARLVQFTDITTSTVADLLYYAHAKNCDLLKESLMDFLIQNRTAALREVSLESFPETQSLFIGLLVSAEHDHADYEPEDYHLMRISRLRRELEDLGLEVDGSRETLIKRLKEAEDEASAGSDAEASNGSQDEAASSDDEEEDGVDSDEEEA